MIRLREGAVSPQWIGEIVAAAGLKSKPMDCADFSRDMEVLVQALSIHTTEKKITSPNNEIATAVRNLLVSLAKKDGELIIRRYRQTAVADHKLSLRARLEIYA